MQELQEFENLLGIKYLAVHFHNRILTFLSSTSLYTFIMALTSALKTSSDLEDFDGTTHEQLYPYVLTDLELLPQPGKHKKLSLKQCQVDRKVRHEISTRRVMQLPMDHQTNLPYERGEHCYIMQAHVDSYLQDMDFEEMTGRNHGFDTLTHAVSTLEKIQKARAITTLEKTSKLEYL